MKKRREIHRQVAQAHEQLYPDRLDQFAAVLAKHYAEAGDDAKTLEYAARAGDAAFRVYASTEAVAQYSLALESAKRVGAEYAATTMVAALLQRLYSNRGRAFELIGRYNEALANYDEMEAQASQRGDRSMELGSLVARSTLRCTPTPVSDSALGKSLSELELAPAHELGDRQAKATARGVGRLLMA